MSVAMVRLGDVCKITMGQAPSGDSYNDNCEGLPLIAGAGDFGCKYPLPKKFTSQPWKICNVDDIILGIRASIGERVWADKPYCLGRGVAGIRVSESLDRTYLWHWLDFAVSDLSSKARGATFKQVNRDDIESLHIPLPPLSEQRRIAAILDQADALRAKRRAAIAELDTLTQAIFVEMFGDPVSNPMGWPAALLSEVGKLDRGVSKVRPRNAPELLGGPYPLIQTGDVANCGGYITSHTTTYSEAGLRQSKLWPAGTLCITIAANIAKTGVLQFPACFPDSVVGFSADRPSTVEYVRIWLSFLQKTLEENAPESAQKNINLALLRDLIIPLPPQDSQDEFASRLKQVQRLSNSHAAALTELDTLFAALQHRAFRGAL